MNLTTFRIWCYVCEREVFLEHRPALVPAPAAPHHCKATEQVRLLPQQAPFCHVLLDGFKWKKVLVALFQIHTAGFLFALIFIVSVNHFPRKQLLSQ